MNKKMLGSAVALALGFSAAAEASLSFDANGLFGAGQQVNVDAFDWDPANVLAVGGNAAVASWIFNETNGLAHGGADESLVLLGHARLIGSKEGNTINTPSGLNNSYEITSVIGFGEKVSGVFGTTATFSFDPTASTNFFEMYYDSSLNADYLTGVGFNDGLNILSSKVAGVSSGFFATLGFGGLLDQYGIDNWGGTLSVLGIGTNSPLNIDISTGPLVVDGDFFKSTLTSFSLSNVSLQAPFDSVDPSHCFTNAPGGGDLDCLDVTDTVPAIGAINGALPIGPGSGGTDFIIQTDYNNPVAAIPEPASVALLGLGLAALGAGSRRRRNTKA